MSFPQPFLSLLVELALFITAVSAIVLIVLLIRDWRKGKGW